MELCEPLTFNGRGGSGHPGGRDSYADSSLSNINRDSSKFKITYLLWGRYLYNPETAPDVHHRFFRQAFGSSGPSLEAALSSSSRILPLITTAWLPSASNHSFWPELYSPISILPPTGKPLYSDSPSPHNVSAISPSIHSCSAQPTSMQRILRAARRTLVTAPARSLSGSNYW